MFAESFLKLWLERHVRGIEPCDVWTAPDGHTWVKVGGRPPLMVDPHRGYSWYTNRAHEASELEKRLENYLDDGASWRPWSLS